MNQRTRIYLYHVLHLISFLFLDDLSEVFVIEFLHICSIKKFIDLAIIFVVCHLSYHLTVNELL
jgi:hypothetical protein